jgi:hypothetical protein
MHHGLQAHRILCPWWIDDNHCKTAIWSGGWSAVGRPKWEQQSPSGWEVDTLPGDRRQEQNISLPEHKLLIPTEGPRSHVGINEPSRHQPSIGTHRTSRAVQFMQPVWQIFQGYNVLYVWQLNYIGWPIEVIYCPTLCLDCLTWSIRSFMLSKTGSYV